MWVVTCDDHTASRVWVWHPNSNHASYNHATMQAAIWQKATNTQLVVVVVVVVVARKVKIGVTSVRRTW